MRKTTKHFLSQYRKPHHLQLSDVAYLLQIDEGNLSRFETGKVPNPKAVLGYHYLFNLSIDHCIIPETLAGKNMSIAKRCDLLLDRLERKSKTKKNLLRIKGIKTIKRRLLTEEEHE